MLKCPRHANGLFFDLGQFLATLDSIIKATMHFGCFILPANHKQTRPDTFFCTCTNNQNSHTCLERSFPSRDAIIWRSRQHNPTPSLNTHSCPPLLLRNMLSFDEEKTGSKFQLFLRAPSAINEVNKLPRLKLMRSVYTQRSPRGPCD